MQIFRSIRKKEHNPSNNCNIISKKYLNMHFVVIVISLWSELLVNILFFLLPNNPPLSASNSSMLQLHQDNRISPDHLKEKEQPSPRHLSTEKSSPQSPSSSSSSSASSVERKKMVEASEPHPCYAKLLTAHERMAALECQRIRLEAIRVKKATTGSNAITRQRRNNIKGTKTSANVNIFHIAHTQRAKGRPSLRSRVFGLRSRVFGWIRSKRFQKMN